MDRSCDDCGCKAVCQHQRALNAAVDLLQELPGGDRKRLEEQVRRLIARCCPHFLFPDEG